MRATWVASLGESSLSPAESLRLRARFDATHFALFGYGSLMFEPEVPPVAMLAADLPGHRRTMNVITSARGIPPGEGPHPHRAVVDSRGYVHDRLIVDETTFRSLALGTEPDPESRIHGRILIYRREDEPEIMRAMNRRENGHEDLEDACYRLTRTEAIVAAGALPVRTWLPADEHPEVLPAGAPLANRLAILLNATPWTPDARKARGIDYVLRAARALEDGGVPDPWLGRLADTLRDEWNRLSGVPRTW